MIILAITLILAGAVMFAIKRRPTFTRAAAVIAPISVGASIIVASLTWQQAGTHEMTASKTAAITSALEG